MSVFCLFPGICHNMTRHNKLLKPNLSNQGRLKLLELWVKISPSFLNFPPQIFFITSIKVTKTISMLYILYKTYTCHKIMYSIHSTLYDFIIYNWTNLYQIKLWIHLVIVIIDKGRSYQSSIVVKLDRNYTSTQWQLSQLRYLEMTRGLLKASDKNRCPIGQPFLLF